MCPFGSLSLVNAYILYVAIVPGAALYTSPVYQFAFLNNLIRLASCYPLLIFEA